MRLKFFDFAKFHGSQDQGGQKSQIWVKFSTGLKFLDSKCSIEPNEKHSVIRQCHFFLSFYFMFKKKKNGGTILVQVIRKSKKL